MVRTIVLVFVLAVPLIAQRSDDGIHLRCGISPPRFTRTILGKRPAKNIRHWTCVVSNWSNETVAIGEAQLIGAMLQQGVLALSDRAARISLLERRRLGPWMTAARLIGDAAQFIAIAQAGGWIEVGGDGGMVIALAAANLPRIAGIVRRRPPGLEGFESLSWGHRVGVEPGQNVQVTMWSGPYSGEPIIDAELRIGVGAR